MRLTGLGSAANKLNELGFHADAVSLYGESLAIAREISAERPDYFGNRDGMIRQYQGGHDQGARRAQARGARHELDPHDQGRRVAAAKRPTLAWHRQAGQKERRAKAGKEDQFIDLVVMIHPRELDKAQVRSLLADAVAAPAKGRRCAGPRAGLPAAKRNRQLATVIESVRTTHPRDLSVAIADASSRSVRRDAERIEPALERLLGLIEQSPLEPLAGAARANARQRAEAARQVPLWLVARACWKQKVAPKPAGAADKLATRASRRLAGRSTIRRSWPCTASKARSLWRGATARARGSLGADARERHRTTRPQSQETGDERDSLQPAVRRQPRPRRPRRNRARPRWRPTGAAPRARCWSAWD